MKSIVDAITNKKEFLDVQICQIVKLIKGGKTLKMSKRDGNFITLKKIFNEVGKDALRYYMISSRSETPMDFDLDRVVEKNKDNPVFYCQYAFARASSVIRKADEIKNIPPIYSSFDKFDKTSLSKYEWEIILKLLSWHYVLKQAAEYRQPHRITNYLEDLCSNFHSFWNRGKDESSLRMLDEDNINKTITKLIWIQSFRNILKESFKIIGIESPETM
jgi:arginyl-tRNA synthetase